MKEFGWTIEYTLSLSFPVFISMFGLIHRVRCDAAIDQVYMPYAAAKVGKNCSKILFDGKGSIFLDSENRKNLSYTEEQLAKANEKLASIIRKNQEKLEQQATSA